MKKLILLLLISTNIFAYTHDQIDEIKVNDKLFQLLHKAYPDCKFKIMKDKPSEFEFLVNVTGIEACAATLPKLEAELVILKTKLHKELTYRTVLAKKKAEAKTLYLSFRSNYHAAAKKASIPHVSNPDAWVRDNCQRVSTHELVDSCLSILNSVNDKVTEVIAEQAAVEQVITDCKLNVNVIQNFNVDTIDGMDVTQLKGVLKYMAKILKCRIK